MSTHGGASCGGRVRARGARPAMWALVLGGGALLFAALPVAPVGADTPSIYLEDSPSAQEQVHEALTLREQGRVGEAAVRLQEVVLGHPHKLMRIESGLYEDTLSWVRRRIAEDEALLEAYRQRYAVEAERLHERARRPEVDPAGLAQVVRQFAVTEAGLKAGMDLAAVHLERADGRGAASVLDELSDHPDLREASHKRRYHYLQAVAGLLAGERTRHAHHRERLEAGGFTAQVEAVAGLARRFEPPPGSLAWVRPGPPLPAAVSAEQLEAPLWDGPVDWTPLGTASDRFAQHDRNRGSDQVPIKPVADERRVYLNQGDRVRALDRDSGWETWVYRWPGVAEASTEARGFLPMRQPQMYERGVAVGGERVYAVMGGASPWPSRWDRGSSITALVAIDRQRGGPLWTIRPEVLDPSLAEAYFVGTPIVSGGRVLVLLRRSQASGFMDTYLAAISVDDGAMLWRRHIASAAVSRRFSGGPRPRMSVDGGQVFVADNYGAVAALDQRSGAVRWARVLVEQPDEAAADEGGDAGAVPAQPRPNPGMRAVPIDGGPAGPAPVAVAAGLIVFDPTGGPPLLLDARTGRAQRKLEDAPWDAVRGVVPPATGLVTDAHDRARDDVLVVSKEGLALVDGETLAVRWLHEPDNGGPASPDGQVALTHAHVLYVGEDELLVLRREDGEVAYRHAISSPANVLPLDHQIVLVDREQARSYMGWARAAERLQQRIAESPHAPEPGMAMAHLALRGGYNEQVLEGVDASLRALRRLRYGPESETPQARAAQQHAFAHLLDLARGEAAAEAGLSEALFNRLATITAGPAQEVAYHLAAAAFLAEAHRGGDAVEHLQAVLSDRTLASQLHEDGHVSRQAGLEAQQRLRGLHEIHGPQIYAKFERRADSELRRLLGPSLSAEAVDLIALAERYPLASAAPAALIAAAERLADRDELAAAAQQLRRARDWAMSAETRAEVVAHTAWLYERQKQPRRAIASLNRLKRETPGTLLHRDGEAITAAAWIERLAGMTADAGPLPRLELPLDRPQVLRGRLLSVPGEPGPGEQRDVLITFHNSHLHRYDGETLAVQWRTPVPADDLELIGADEDQLLFWSPGRGRLFALHEATGEPAWGSERAARLLEEVGDVEGREAAHHVDQRRFMRMVEHAPRVREQREQQRHDPDRPEIFTAVGSGTVALADRQGRVVGIDRRSGRVLWRLMAPTEMVLRVAAHEDSLVLAGINGSGTDAESGAMTVVDLLSGEMRLPLIEDRHEPRWVGFAGDERLAMVSDEQITVYRLATGEVAWRSEFEEHATVTDGWADHRVLVLISDARTARMYDAAGGEMLSRVDLTTRRVPRPVRGDPVEDRWYMLTSDGLKVVDIAGRTQWRDAISDTDRNIHGYLATQDHIILLADDNQAEADRERIDVMFRGPDGGVIRIPAEHEPDPGAERRGAREVDTHLYLLDRRTGALVAEHPIGPLPAHPDLGSAIVQPNRLIVPLAEHTLVIPGKRAGGEAE